MRQLIANWREIVRAYHREFSPLDSFVEIALAFWITACALACGMAFLIIVGGDHA